ncbi:MAG: GTP cyclohydrolase II [Acidobacteriaceae bacterium]
MIAVELEKKAEAKLPTQWGEFRILGFEGKAAGSEKIESVVALVMADGDIAEGAPLVRVHSQCLTGDVFSSLRCDCRQQLEMALGMIAAEGRGILIYEQQEGRGIGLMAKLQAYELQEQGRDTVEANEELGFKADEREFAVPAAVLRALGVTRVRLLSNNPSKVKAVEEAGVRVIERVSAAVEEHQDSAAYLRTKREKMGHLIG